MDILQPRYSLCKNLAINLLLEQNNSSFVIDARKLDYKENIKFISFKEYCEKTGVLFGDITNEAELLDGYTIKRKDKSYILYYEYNSIQRLRFSLAHEIGHVLLKHTNDSNIEEMEANCFASHLLIPNCVLLSLIHNKFHYDLDATRNTFGVSWETASHKLNYIYKFENYNFSENEIQLKEKYFNGVKRVI